MKKLTVVGGVVALVAIGISLYISYFFLRCAEGSYANNASSANIDANDARASFVDEQSVRGA